MYVDLIYIFKRVEKAEKFIGDLWVRLSSHFWRRVKVSKRLSV